MKTFLDWFFFRWLYGCFWITIFTRIFLSLFVHGKVSPNSDINQIQFLLYQFARACHIIKKMESILDDVESSEWCIKMKEEVDLASCISTVDHAVMRWVMDGENEGLNLKPVSGIIGLLIKLSRLFSKFYSKCRVLPGLYNSRSLLLHEPTYKIPLVFLIGF